MKTLLELLKEIYEKLEYNEFYLFQLGEYTLLTKKEQEQCDMEIEFPLLYSQKLERPGRLNAMKKMGEIEEAKKNGASEREIRKMINKIVDEELSKKNK
jgi:hypothetical protein